MRATRIVGHDYAVSVVQELLARHAEGALAVELEGVHLLNGGVYPDTPPPAAVAGSRCSTPSRGRS